MRERGESLLELMISVTILGVAVVAVVAGLGTAVLVSDAHRKQATAGAEIAAHQLQHGVFVTHEMQRVRHHDAVERRQVERAREIGMHIFDVISGEAGAHGPGKKVERRTWCLKLQTCRSAREAQRQICLEWDHLMTEKRA